MACVHTEFETPTTDLSESDQESEGSCTQRSVGRRHHLGIRSSFVYLAAILDLYSRRIVGWAISKRIDSALCVAALRMALDSRRPGPDCIHHSDRGSQYASADYVDLLGEHGVQISMSAKGNPYDNAFIESFTRLSNTRRFTYGTMKPTTT